MCTWRRERLDYLAGKKVSLLMKNHLTLSCRCSANKQLNQKKKNAAFRMSEICAALRVDILASTCINAHHVGWMASCRANGICCHRVFQVAYTIICPFNGHEIEYGHRIVAIIGAIWALLQIFISCVLQTGKNGNKERIIIKLPRMFIVRCRVVCVLYTCLRNSRGRLLLASGSGLLDVCGIISNGYPALRRKKKAASLASVLNTPPLRRPKKEKHTMGLHSQVIYAEKFNDSHNLLMFVSSLHFGQKAFHSQHIAQPNWIFYSLIIDTFRFNGPPLRLGGHHLFVRSPRIICNRLHRIDHQNVNKPSVDPTRPQQIHIALTLLI